MTCSKILKHINSLGVQVSITNVFTKKQKLWICIQVLIMYCVCDFFNFIFRDTVFKFGLVLTLKIYLLMEFYIKLETWNLRNFNICK